MPALWLPNGKAANCNDDELRGATVLDIGANKGIYCFWLARAVRISGRVIAFTLKSVWFAALAVNFPPIKGFGAAQYEPIDFERTTGASGCHEPVGPRES